MYKRYSHKSILTKNGKPLTVIGVTRSNKVSNLKEKVIKSEKAILDKKGDGYTDEYQIT